MDDYIRELLLNLQKQMSQVAEDTSYMKGVLEGVQKYEEQIKKNAQDIDNVGDIARDNRSRIENQQHEIDEIKKKQCNQNGTFVKIATGLFGAMGSAIVYLAHKLGIF